jgi:hypothetical protein
MSQELSGEHENSRIIGCYISAGRADQAVFPAWVPVLCVATNIEELYNSVLTETPLAPCFSYYAPTDVQANPSDPNPTFVRRSVAEIHFTGDAE